MNDYITTYSKKHINPLKPGIDDIDINDIAHALSLSVRGKRAFSGVLLSVPALNPLL